MAMTTASPLQSPICRQALPTGLLSKLQTNDKYASYYFRCMALHHACKYVDVMAVETLQALCVTSAASADGSIEAELLCVTLLQADCWQLAQSARNIWQDDEQHAGSHAQRHFCCRKAHGGKPATDPTQDAGRSVGLLGHAAFTIAMFQRSGYLLWAWPPPLLRCLLCQTAYALAWCSASHAWSLPNTPSWVVRL